MVPSCTRKCLAPRPPSPSHLTGTDWNWCCPSNLSRSNRPRLQRQHCSGTLWKRGRSSFAEFSPAVLWRGLYDPCSRFLAVMHGAWTARSSCPSALADVTDRIICGLVGAICLLVRFTKSPALKLLASAQRVRKAHAAEDLNVAKANELLVSPPATRP